jgi:hypothetical protein
MPHSTRAGADGITRGRFMRFLGKLGMLSLVPGSSAAAALAPDQVPGALATRRVVGPLINGRRFSDAALTGTLATRNLENIRDVVTGRFFGRAAEAAYTGGHTPVINWRLGGRGSSSGCFFFAAMTDPKRGRPAVDNCSVFMLASRSNRGGIIVEVIKSSGGRLKDIIGGGTACSLELSCEAQCSANCPSDCGDRCASMCMNKCDSGYCGSQCSPKSELSLAEISSYPADRFAAELTQILGTTDVGRLQQELMQIICSDEVLNRGLDEFLAGAGRGVR